MIRLAPCIAAVVILAPAAPADACMPPSIQFRLGSARIDTPQMWAIDDIVISFRARRDVRVVVTAYTDALGPADANLRLARRRGEAVKAALVRRGIPAGAIDVVAHGERHAQGGTAAHLRSVWLRVVPNSAPPRQDQGCGA